MKSQMFFLETQRRLLNAGFHITPVSRTLYQVKDDDGEFWVQLYQEVVYFYRSSEERYVWKSLTDTITKMDRL